VTVLETLAERDRQQAVPGEPGLWVLILGDLLIFGWFFALIVMFRNENPALFAAGQAQLHQDYAMFNALVLLTSSLLVANGMRMLRMGNPRASRMFAGAIVCGAVFAGVKAIEYTSLVNEGHLVAANEFFLYYFFFTGLHLGHVVLGMAALAVAAVWARPRHARRPRRERAIEGVAVFWHLVDLLWIVLFALLYLMR
jgi:nitric oxide reductase NorE protein